MEKIRKIIVTGALVCSLLVITPSTTKADVTGAGDAALLLQQVLQYVQDFNLDDARWSDMISKVNRAKQISNVIMKGKRGYDAVNNVYTASAQVLRTCRSLSEYKDYVGEFGSNFQWRRCGSIYNNYERRTATLLEDMSKSLELLGAADNENPHQLLSTLNETVESFTNSLDKFDKEAVSDMVGVVKDVTVDRSAKKNCEFYKTVLC